jgi:anti-sigma regulatory factor (Ser/Thr protein kinase)/biotin operon repressor
LGDNRRLDDRLRPEARILARLRRRPAATGGELRAMLGISRQALSVHLRRLLLAGRIVRAGETRGARYSLARAGDDLGRNERLVLRGLDEAGTYERLATRLNLRSSLRPNVEAILRYAFTEMLNNAIEHSRSERGQLAFRLAPGAVGFELRDRGIGVFASIASKLGLPDEHAALVELVKGRTTTEPERHTGEGLFFTARVGDRFVVRSHRIQVEWDREKDDVFVSQIRPLAGTEVVFQLERSVRRRLEDVFAEFAPADFDYRFERTSVRVKLVQTDYVSRSEARRLLANLEKFREVALDLRGVRSIGQGFADEVFRVFQAAHPGTRVSVEHASPPVAAMIRHVAGRPPAP